MQQSLADIVRDHPADVTLIEMAAAVGSPGGRRGSRASGNACPVAAPGTVGIGTPIVPLVATRTKAPQEAGDLVVAELGMNGVYEGLTVIEIADRRNQWAGKLL